MYQIISENLTHLGGPMGTEYTTNNWVEHSVSLQAAKEKCQKDYGKSIEWIKTATGLRSPDLLHVMYYINKITPIDEGR